jgi:acetyl esterase/lipase
MPWRFYELAAFRMHSYTVEMISGIFRSMSLAIRPLITGLSLGLAFLFTGCGQHPTMQSSAGTSLAEARKGFVTQLLKRQKGSDPAEIPPADLFKLVKYRSTPGKMSAYLTPPPGDGRRHPAIIWIFGGFGNDIGATAWLKAPSSNDQSASAFREAGIVMMYPSLRGGNDNPGFQEQFLGETDDVMAAADFLAKQDYVDPQRIYLGGHSTGGTLVLLVAELTNRFRAVFAFGPVSNVSEYGAATLVFNSDDKNETDLRSPLRWLDDVQGPVFVLEGASGRSNISELRKLSRATRNPVIHFHPINGANHFSTLAPVTRLIAKKILSDNGPACNIGFTDEELSGSVLNL